MLIVEQTDRYSKLGKGGIPFSYSLYDMNIRRVSTFSLSRNDKWIAHASLLCDEVYVVRNVYA